VQLPVLPEQHHLAQHHQSHQDECTDVHPGFERTIVLMKPKEDVSDPIFRAICREQGADICFTEFVNVDGLLDRSHEYTFQIM
jgi:predicted RNA binding protein YcfA (HicA-like mRNA interferase family)